MVQTLKTLPRNCPSPQKPTENVPALKTQRRNCLSPQKPTEIVPAFKTLQKMSQPLRNQQGFSQPSEAYRNCPSL